jgi:hypothetical protein
MHADRYAGPASSPRLTQKSSHFTKLKSVQEALTLCRLRRGSSLGCPASPRRPGSRRPRPPAPPRQGFSWGPLLRGSVCHCLDCQKRSGSAFAAQARWPEAQVTLTGRSKTWQREADSGHKATFTPMSTMAQCRHSSGSSCFGDGNRASSMA